MLRQAITLASYASIAIPPFALIAWCTGLGVEAIAFYCGWSAMWMACGWTARGKREAMR